MFSRRFRADLDGRGVYKCDSSNKLGSDSKNTLLTGNINTVLEEKKV